MVVSLHHTFPPLSSRPPPTLGTLLSFQPSCCSVLSPLRWLHAMHAVTRLIQVLRPPLLTGVTWSMVRVVSRPLQPQYLAGEAAVRKGHGHERVERG